jgi:hypothetical protein
MKCDGTLVAPFPGLVRVAPQAEPATGDETGEEFARRAKPRNNLVDRYSTPATVPKGDRSNCSMRGRVFQQRVSVEY